MVTFFGNALLSSATNSWQAQIREQSIYRGPVCATQSNFELTNSSQTMPKVAS